VFLQRVEHASGFIGSYLKSRSSSPFVSQSFARILEGLQCPPCRQPGGEGLFFSGSSVSIKFFFFGPVERLGCEDGTSSEISFASSSLLQGSPTPPFPHFPCSCFQPSSFSLPRAVQSSFYSHSSPPQHHCQAPNGSLVFRARFAGNTHIPPAPGLPTQIFAAF